MNGIHDLGGMHGFGPIVRGHEGAGFRRRFEGRVHGIMLLLGARGFLNIDAFRHGIETLPPARYLASSYYGRWIASVEALLIRAGVLAEGELDARAAAARAGAAAPARPQPGAPPRGSEPLDFLREIDAAPRFGVGAAVRARNLHPSGHTRLPRYARGRRGVIARVHPACVFPDTHAHGRGEQPQYVYSVRFAGDELWGDAAEPGSSVLLDLFESYLEPA